MGWTGSRYNFSVLGTFEVHGGDGDTAATAAKERALLALLALHPNEVVSLDRVIDALWGDEPPASARTTVRAYASRLRKRFGSALSLVWRDPGYVLEVRAEQVDAFRFESLVARGSDALLAGDPSLAAGWLREALGLWRGPMLLELRDEPFVEVAATRFEQLRLVALERRIEADLGCGRHREVVAELEALVAAHPYREVLWAHLIVALYRSGRQVDALAAYDDARIALLEGLGLDPGPELQRLQHAVLTQDPAIDWRPLAAPLLPAAQAGDTPSAPSSAVDPSGGEVQVVRTADDVRIAVASTGDGPPLVFVRAWISHLEHLWHDPGFRSFFSRLAEHRRVIRFDMRGNGLSDRDVGEPGLDDLVLDLEAVMDECVDGPAVVWGTTFGGPIAARYAARRPDRVRALILDGTFAHGADLGSDEQWESFRTMLSLLRTMPEPAFAALSYFTDNDPVMDHERRMARARQAIDGAYAEHLYNLARTFDVTGDLHRLAVPTLVLHRERSRSVPIAAARQVAMAIPGAELVRLPGSAHNLWEGDPEPALQQMLAFLSSVG